MSDGVRSRACLNALVGARLIGALALLTTAGIHLEQYVVADFSLIPTIGPLFLLTFGAGTVLGLYLLTPGSLFAGRIRRLADAYVAFTGCAVAGGALGVLLISEHTPLFGFMEHGYRLEIVIAIVAEVAAIGALGAFLVLSYTGAGRTRVRRHRPDGAINMTPPTAAQRPQ